MDGTARPDRSWRSRLQRQEENVGPVVGANDDSIDAFWRTAVEKYTKCALTKGSDKLNAIWGIAKLVRDAKGVEYAEGLWEQNLEDQLTWWVVECTLRERPSESKEDNLKRDIPSWSWASMDGLIEIPDFLTDKGHFTVKNHSGGALTFEFVKNQRRGSVTKENSSRVGHGENARADVRDSPPELKEKSLKIQCHVGRGSLEKDQKLKRWFLRVNGLDGVDVEARPDLIPDPARAESCQPFFAIMSAKQRVRPIENINVRGEATNEEQDTTHANDDASTVYAEEIVYDGVGILMKEVKDDHFKRTGAFVFRNLSRDQFEQLHESSNNDNLPVGNHDSNLERKIWLG